MIVFDFDAWGMALYVSGTAQQHPAPPNTQTRRPAETKRGHPEGAARVLGGNAREGQPHDDAGAIVMLRCANGCCGARFRTSKYEVGVPRQLFAAIVPLNNRAVSAP